MNKEKLLKWLDYWLTPTKVAPGDFDEENEVNYEIKQIIKVHSEIYAILCGPTMFPTEKERIKEDG